MIGNNNYIKVSRRAWILCIFLALSIIVAGTAHAQLACNVCHTMPPTDSATGDRDPATGAFKGNHQGHSSSSVNSCVPCHGADVTTYQANHSAPPPGSGNKPVIRLTSALNNYSIGHNLAAYSRGTFFNQTTIPPTPLGTCSNVNCHFEKTTPAWGTANFVSPTDCDKCHGAPPSGAATGADGSHAKHVQAYPGVTNCQKCHPDNTTFQHATSAGNRPLNVTFAAAPNNGSGSYTGPLNDYLPSQTNVFGDCSATYCHGTTMSVAGDRNGGTDIIPTWGTASSGQCGTCHGATVGAPPKRGSHSTHTGSAQRWYGDSFTPPFNNYIYERQIACSVCHKNYQPKHVDGNADWSYDSTSNSWLSGARYKGISSGSATPVPSTYGQCTNLYCHSIAQTSSGGPLTGLVGEYQTPTWGNRTEGNCGTCHLADQGHSYWAGKGAAAPEISSGSHTKHLPYLTMMLSGTGPSRCAVCHNYAGADDITNCSTTPCHVGQSAHVDHKVDVKFPATLYGATAAYTGTPTPGDGFGSCDNVYCHSNGLASSPTYYAATWGNAASGACGTCHGANAAAPPASQRHAKHVGASSPYVYACALCHAGIVRHSANANTLTTISSAQYHVNKSRNVRFDALNQFGNYSSVNLSCNSAYCHSIGNTSVTAGSLPGVYNGKIYAKPKWTDAGPLACNACHGRSTGNGMPDYANGGVGDTANSHSRHVSIGNIACVECHEKTTKSNTSIRSTSPSRHVDGTSHDVFFNLSGNSKIGTYDNGAKTCSNTYCHGAAPSAAWGSPTLPCNSCHSANNSLPGAHQIHIQTTALASSYSNMSGNVSSTTQYRFSCAACHQPGSGKASHANGPQTGGINGPAEIFYGFTSSTRKGSYTYGGASAGTDPTGGFSYTAGGTGCETTYCHSNGAGAAGNGAVDWSATASSATNNRCKTCHKYNAASGLTVDTGDHPVHVSGAAYNFSCRKCHAATTIDGASIVDNSKHVNKAVNVAFNNSTTALNGTYNGIASPMMKNPGSPYGSCSNTYCHSTGTSTTPAAPNVTPTWGGDFNTTCSGCHGNDNAADFKMGSVGSATHSKHVQTYSYGCVKCHAATTSSNRSISSYANHVDRQVNVAFNNRTTAINGTYNGVASPMAKLPGSAFGTCTNTYCHSPGDKAVSAASYNPPAVVPAWGGASLTCKDCHKSNFASGSNMTSGSHGYHINWAGAMGYAQDIKCVKCHAVTANANMTIANAARHTNGQIEIAFNNTSSAASGTYKGTLATPASPMTKAPGSATGQCANVYCHSSGQGDNAGPPTYYTTPAWGTSDMNFCGKCHGVPYSHGSFGTITPLTTGSHVKHLKYRMSDLNSEYDKCVVCHAYNRTGYNTSSCNQALCHGPGYQKHSNYELNVNFPVFFGASSVYNGTTKPGHDGAGYANSTCSLVYCHSNGLATSPTYVTPKWGDPSTAACGTCHGAKADTPPASTRHVKHVGSAGQYQYACALCHAGVVKHNANSSTYAVISTATDTLQWNGSRLHVNKSRDVWFDTINPFGRYSSYNQSCNSAYCHSIGKTAVSAGNLPGVYGGKIYAKTKWTDVGPLACNACHGRSTGNGMPDYANAGAAGSATANSHDKHVTSSAIACVECHEKTTKTGTSIRNTFPGKHVNNSASDVFFNLSGINTAGVYTAGTRSCTTVACHSNGRGTYQSAQWGVTDNCDYCHPIASLGGSHAKHVDLSQSLAFYTYTANNSTPGVHNFGCSNCHPLTTAQHVKGTITLDLRPVVGVGMLRSKNSVAITASGPVNTANSGTSGTSGTNVVCLNVYCHSNGYSANTVFATTPNWYGGTFAGDRCAACHGNSPNSTIVGSPAHYNTNFAGIGNAGGHVVGIHYDNIYTGTSGLATPGELGTSSHGNPTTSTSLNCDNCHFTTVESRNNDKNTVCVTCHNGANLRGDAEIASRATHVNGRPDVVFDAIQVRSKAQLNAQSNYTTAFTRVGGYKTSGGYDIAKTALDTATMWNSATKTCSNVSCHFNKPVSWSNTGSAYKCLICHDSM